MKTIIKRNLPLDTKYTLIDKKYIPLVESSGCCCDNCGKIIANIATVKNQSNVVFNIGFDCLETLLINNNLLDAIGVAEYEKVKKMLPKIIRFSKTISELLSNNPRITGILFEKQKYESEWYTFYWLQNNETTSRSNDNVKLKDMDFDFMVSTLKNIFPKLQILVK